MAIPKNALVLSAAVVACLARGGLALPPPHHERSTGVSPPEILITHQGHGKIEEDALQSWKASKSNGSIQARSADVAMMDMGTSPWSSTSPLLFKRQREENEDGALLCNNGPCVDDSCCGPDNICGYGPDICGDGCTSNCDAQAMCGRYSDGGDISCGLNLCCSWGGWCGVEQVHCIGPNEYSLCQEGYGKCEIIRPQSYGENSGTTDGRFIGYYQASNVRYRACNRISPKHINTEPYTHLYWAFASIDPDSFRIKPWYDDEEDQIREFTALKGQGRDLQPWVAVGGYAFSNPGSTATTWSDLCASASGRAAFIESTREFMDDFGFQGVDLDWEYPGTPERGGKRADIENFVTLLKEMREAYGTEYGISLTLAPDYWYLRYFDVTGLEPYVDHMGFMAYDLHGFWDEDVEALDPVVRGQANIKEIYNNTIPLAYAGVDPSKISFGVAWYGRGYTLADPSCNTLGCPFIGPSNPGKCTNSDGTLSLVEIKQMIENGEAESHLLEDIAMKELVWDDQWVGYDDEETVEMKTRFANDQGFGGLMAWSVDFNSGYGDSNEPPVSEDGRCGPDYLGATCPDSGFGDCCSASGWCGSSDTHCGETCYSGNCQKGGETSTGACGAGNNDFVCGDWEDGSCCSASGWCGSTDAYCGDGCQSGCPGDDDDDDDGGGGSDPPPIDPPDTDDDDLYPPCDGDYSTLEELEAAEDEIPLYCGPTYVLPILQNKLRKAQERYSDIMDDGYDGYFNVYAEYIVNNAFEATKQFMRDRGDEFFDCTVVQNAPCCNLCGKVPEVPDCPNGCFEECDVDSPYDDGFRWQNVSMPCPPNYDERMSGGDNSKLYATIYWDLREEDEEDFWAEIQTEVGVPGDKLLMDNMKLNNPDTDWGGVSCAKQEQEYGWHGMDDICKVLNYWRDVPRPAIDLDTDDITNPKDLVKEALAKAEPMFAPMSVNLFEILSGDYIPNPDELVDALSIPVLMVEESVGLMEEVVEMAKEIEEVNKKTFILTLLTSLLFVLPVLGSTISQLGLRSLGRALVVISEGSNTAMAIHAVVEDPKSAPILIFALIMGANDIRNTATVSRTAEIRRNMEAGSMKSLSAAIENKLDVIGRFVSTKSRAVCGL